MLHAIMRGLHHKTVQGACRGSPGEDKCGAHVRPGGQDGTAESFRVSPAVFILRERNVSLLTPILCQKTINGMEASAARSVQNNSNSGLHQGWNMFIYFYPLLLEKSHCVSV